MVNKKLRIGIYAGSFRPFHVGHWDIALQAERVFDKVIIARGNNPEKVYKYTSQFNFPRVVINRFEVVEFDGLLTDFLISVGRQYQNPEIVLVRGLRNGDDVTYEQNQLQFLKEMMPMIQPAYFLCDRKHEHVSSTALRALKEISETEYLKYIPTDIVTKVRRRLDKCGKK